MAFREWIKTEIEVPPLIESRRQSLEEVAWATLLKVKDEIIRDPGNLSSGGGRQGLAAGALSSGRQAEESPDRSVGLRRIQHGHGEDRREDGAGSENNRQGGI